MKPLLKNTQSSKGDVLASLLADKMYSDSKNSEKREKRKDEVLFSVLQSKLGGRTVTINNSKK